MVTRRTHGMLSLPLAVALLASTVACGEARPVALASNGLSDCTTCHGLPPATDVHAIHFTADTGASGGVPHAQLTCLHCHKNVTSVTDPDHINRADGTLVPVPAEVRFDEPASLAAVTQPGATRAGTPAYDKTARTCSNVYCHGAGLKAAAKNAGASPAWGAPQGTVHCGDCHGIPPADHASGITQLACHRCHGDAIDASGNVNPATHVNGKVDLAAGVGSNCYVDRRSPEPRRRRRPGREGGLQRVPRRADHATGPRPPRQPGDADVRTTRQEGRSDAHL